MLHACFDSTLHMYLFVIGLGVYSDNYAGNNLSFGSYTIMKGWQKTHKMLHLTCAGKTCLDLTDQASRQMNRCSLFRSPFCKLISSVDLHVTFSLTHTSHDEVNDSQIRIVDCDGRKVLKSAPATIFVCPAQQML